MTDITIPGGKIRAFVERIENLDIELLELNEQKKEVFAETKAEGFDVRSSKRSSKCESKTKKSAMSARVCSISTCAPWSRLEPRRLPGPHEKNGGLAIQ